MDRRAFVAMLPGAAGLGAAARAEVVVFAASSLTDALVELAAAFESRTGVHVVASFGGSNDLARQIRAGAPADLFLSADPLRVDELSAAGLVRPEDRFDLLSNRLAVVVRSDSSLRIRTAAELALARTIAIGDPDAVPAGRYAREWLGALGLWTSLRERFVPTLDARAALNAVASGAADAGVVYRSDAISTPRVRTAFEVVGRGAPRITCALAVLAGHHLPEVLAFAAALRSAEAAVVFERLGFLRLPER